MEKSLEYLKSNPVTSLETNQFINEVIDPIYDSLRERVGVAIVLLNSSRKLIREGSTLSIKQGLSDYEKFKDIWIKLISEIDEIKSFLPKDKNIQTIEEMLKKSVNRDIQSKIPKPPKNYLDESEINESDIDWIIKRIKDYLGKYSQVYTSLRINLLLKIIT